MLKACALLLGVSLFAQTTAPAPGRIKIGVFLSLTGATAAYGISSLNAIKLATEEVNHSGGINGKKIELFVEDDHSNTLEVIGIVDKLIKDDKVDALIGEPVSTRAEMGAIVAQRSGVVMISPAARCWCSYGVRCCAHALRRIQTSEDNGTIRSSRLIGTNQRLPRSDGKDHARCKSQRAGSCLHASD